MRRVYWSLGLSGLLGVGVLGCGVGTAKDPVAQAVAESGQTITVAPEAAEGPEAADLAQKELERQQAEADRKSRGRR